MKRLGGTTQRNGDGISVGFLQPLAQGLERLGIDAGALKTALASAGTEEFEARVPASAVDDALEGLARSTSPSLLLELAANAPPGSFGFFDYCAAASETLRDAIQRLSRYFVLLSERAGLLLEENEDDTTARLRESFTVEYPKRRYMTELALAIIAVRSRQLCGEAFRIRSVEFMHPRIAEDAVYEKVFGVVPRFEGTSDELVLDRACLDLPIRSANPTIAALIEQHAMQLVSRQDEKEADPFLTKLRDAIVHSLESGVEVASCANALKLSPRTLQRRLREQGTSFSKVIDEVRHELAVDLLRRKKERSISEVAFQLGFRDITAFHRAFRRWTGATPHEFRRNSA